MPRAVIILGAGASADFGVPTLRNIFKDPYARIYLESNVTLQRQLDELFWLPRGHNVQTSDESVTIEEMLTILRDWERENVEKPSSEYFADFRKNLYHLIYHAVFYRKSSRSAHLNQLIGLISKMDQVTWASFNWDCIFEASFWYASGGPGPYGGRSNPNLVVRLQKWRNGGGRHQFLKLHGSVNWWMVDGTLSYLGFGGPGNELQQKWIDYCRPENTRDYPVILEPSAYKYTGDVYDLLKCQWDTFFRRLCEADYVLILGYSLPYGDVEARCKVLTAFQANDRAKWLVVDPAAETCRRYRSLLGNVRVTVLETGLAGFNNDLQNNLQTAFGVDLS